MASIIKADNIQKVSDGTNIIKKCGSTITLGSCGATIALACGASQTGFGRTGTVDWCTTAKTAPFTGVSGKGYFVNTTSGAVTVTLPATPTAGDIISIADYASTFQTNNLTICNNGSKLNGVCATANLSTQGQSITLVYVDATRGWKNTMDSTSDVSGAAYIVATGGTISYCGDYKIHTFTSDGCFSVSEANVPANAYVDYVVVAGGGGAGFNSGSSSGGGGAGGFRESHTVPVSGCYTASPLASCTSLPVSVTTYPITIGGGGSAGTGPATPRIGSNGSNSIFSTITSSGGGGGGATPISCRSGSTGGSGGGASGYFNAPDLPSPGSAGNTPPVSPPQGNSGGTMNGGYSSAGGGGAAAAGADSSPGPDVPATNGGAGATTSISGSPSSYGGGGGGAGYGPPNPAVKGAGGIGGGGDGGGSCRCTMAGAAGTTNTGGGGGGGGYTPPLGPGNGAAGGSGIVIIRYKYQ